MKKIFTFLVAFLATMSGAVWGQEHGSLERPLDISNYNDALLIDLDDCSGNYYITTNGRTNTYGIKVGGSDDVLNPANVTIYLINAKFDVGGSAIIVGTGEMPDIHTDIIRFVNLELVLIGENEITSDGSAAAIKLRNGDNVKLTISEKSTGILNINMTGDEPINQVAIGERGEEGLLWQDALHDCGSLTINGGTIVTNGYIGEFDSHAFRMNGNGIVVAKNIETSDIHKNWLVDNGIYYEKEEDGQNALNVKGDVTISSPIPDENVYVGEGNSLTLGRGDVLDADKVKIEEGGTLNAYKVTYNINKPTDLTYVNPATVPSIYCGANTPLATIDPILDPADTYYYFGWANGTNIVTTTEDTTPTNVETVDVEAVWVVASKTITTEKGSAIAEFSLVYPEDVAGIKFTLAEGITLPDALTNNSNKISGTLNASGTTEYTASYGEKSETVTLTFEATETGEDPIIKPGDDEGNTDGWTWDATANQWTRIYDGDAHPFTKITVTYTDETAEGEDKTKTETLTVGEGADATVTYSTDKEGTATVSEIKNADTYYAHITINKEGVISGEVEPVKLFIDKRPMVIDINKLTAEDVAGITEEKPTVTIGTEDVTFKAVEGKEESGIVEKEKDDAVVNGTITVTPAESTEEGKKVYTITVDEDNFTLSGVEGGEFTATNYKATYTYNGKSIEDGTITETIDDLEPGDVIPDDGDDDGNEWSWDAQGYALVYDGKGHGVKSVTVKDETGETIDNAELKSVVYFQGLDEGGYAEMGKGELPTDAGMYQAEVVVSVNGESKTATIPLLITCRPLRVDFNLTNLDESAIGGTLFADDYVSYENNGENEGLVPEQTPNVEGEFHVANTSNDNGKYDITAEGVKLSDTETFASSNYSIKYYVNGELLTDTDEDGDNEGIIDGDSGADINDDYSGGTINTKQYRLYLANKDYNVVDAKADYAAEGLELFSRHDKKYTKAGGSFTVWYEKDGVANAGGYRIFWSNRANGEYKEVKFDTVSEYFQIRNVQSNVYVKIYAADGFPVGNEEISAADYRAYAQPNKIVVITPQPTDVQIISMAGAVVATDKVTGQREFANLTEGVYIVRMGETVVKLQVRK